MAMYDSFYPRYGVAKLREQHGFGWSNIIDEVHALHVTDPRVMAFTLSIKKIRKQNDLAVSLCSDPFCAICTAEILEHFEGSEEELVDFYFSNLREIRQVLKVVMPHHRIERAPQAVHVVTAA